ncbi:MAG: hypothetical protein ACPGU1_16505 [Myxococcota bacterium]
MSVLVIGAAALLVACPGQETDEDGDALDAPDARDNDAVSEPPSRTVHLGGWAESVTLSAGTLASPERLSAEPLGEPGDVEVVVIPLDLFGVPWDAFDGPNNQPTELPAEWLTQLSEAEAVVSELRSALSAASSSTTEEPLALHLVLAVSPITRDGTALSPGTMELVGKAPQWENCFDPSAEGDPTRYGARYAGYVNYLVNRFEPDAVILGRTMNRYEVACGEAKYSAMLDVIHAAHDRLSEADVPPTTIVEVDVEDLYGYPKLPGRCVAMSPAECFETRRGLLGALRVDALGLHSMPAVALEELEAWTPDWLERVAEASPTDHSVVTSTSLPATSLSEQGPGGGPCIQILESEEALQRAWLTTVTMTAEALEMLWVAWHPVRDLAPEEVVVSCPCSGDEEICFYLDHVIDERATATRRSVSNGLWTHAGEPRLSGQQWLSEVQQ